MMCRKFVPITSGSIHTHSDVMGTFANKSHGNFITHKYNMLKFPMTVMGKTKLFFIKKSILSNLFYFSKAYFVHVLVRVPLFTPFPMLLLC